MEKMSERAKELFADCRIMTVEELIARLMTYPCDADVYLMGTDDGKSALWVEGDEIATT